MLFVQAILSGSKVGLYSGDPAKLFEDMAILKPTFLASVPRIYNKIFGAIQAKFAAETGMRGVLTKHAVDSKLWYLRNGQGFTHRIYDALVFEKVRGMLGGKVRLMITGASPISGEVLDFLKVCFCCDLTEGYGMTETGAASCVTFPGDK